MRTRVLCVLVLTVLSAGSGCSRKVPAPSHLIVGRWQVVNTRAPLTWVFESNGVFRIEQTRPTNTASPTIREVMNVGLFPKNAKWRNGYGFIEFYGGKDMPLTIHLELRKLTDTELKGIWGKGRRPVHLRKVPSGAPE